MQIREITRFLESVAPRSLQESYDNSGLIVGYPNQKVNKVLVSLDVTEAVVEEAITKIKTLKSQLQLTNKQTMTPIGLKLAL